jgi:hypothetical protein
MIKTTFSGWQGRVIFGLLLLNLVATVTVASAQAGSARTVSADYPAVAPLDPRRVEPRHFSAADLRLSQGEQPMSYYLVHLAELANSIEVEGVDAGWISRKSWRSASEFRNRDTRVMENVMSLAFFYSKKESWNVYYGDRALRRRLELALRHYLERMAPDGLMIARPHDLHIGLRLANSMFFTKFMGEALVLLEEGPGIDRDLLEALYDAQRRAIKKVLTSDLATYQGRQFSNQYGNVFSGVYAYLSLRDDAEIRSLLEECIRNVVPLFQSPAGYLYENNSVDFGYTLLTHHSNVHGAWHHGEVTGMDLEWLREETQLWAEWLAYNTVPSHDFSWFALNRAIESRQDRYGFEHAVAPFARDIPLMRAFVASEEEIVELDKQNRRKLLETWPKVDNFGQSFWSFSPYAFLHRDHYEWFPSERQRAEARQELPYIASDRFTHQRVDDRRFLEVSFVRRPGYYAVFNVGESMSAVQTFGLGLLWHPEAGPALQAQTRMPEAAWGTRLEGARTTVESESLEVRYFIDKKEVFTEVGNRDLQSGDFEVHFRLNERNDKILRFEEDRILVLVNPGGGFVEQIPLLVHPGESPEIVDGSVRVRRGNRTLVIRPEGELSIRLKGTDREIGPDKVVVVEIEGARRLTYSLSFE